ncbi:MAG: metallophosphatase family protein [Gemmatimonadetes bacterium]|nr:metallophosphatase family protein [Gemmatimonadota bacterium]
MKIGIISDTHGLLRPQVFDALQGVEHVLHAGDVGDPDILVELAALAPVTAVWGNVDGMQIRARVPEVARLELGGVRIAIMHGMQLGSPTPQKAAAAHPDAGLVVFGHSHRPIIQQVGPTLAVNPGSAGPRRFKDPVTVAVAEIENGRVQARLIDLIPRKP